MSGLKKLYFGWTAYFKKPWNQAVLPASVKALYINDGIQLLSPGTSKKKK